jgi:MFS family permease
VSSDASLLLVNQVLVICEFNLVSNFGIIGAVVGLSQISLAISTIFFGYTSDKYSRKKVLIIGGSIWAMGELLVSLSPNVYWLMIFRIMASAGAGSSAPVSMSLLSDIFASEKRGNSFAWWGLATTVGGIAGGGIGLAFNRIDYSFSDDAITLAERIAYIQSHYTLDVISQWRVPFLLMFFLGLVFVGLVFLVKEPKRGATESALRNVLADENVDYSKSYKIKPEDLKYIYRRKSNFWLIINFVDTIFSGLILGFVITWLTVEVGVSFEIANLGPILPFALILVGSLLWGQFYWAKRADKMVVRGDKAGRVKIAIFCGVTHIPFLIIGFLFYPNFGNRSFFKGALDLSANPIGFTTIFIIMGIILGIGLGLEFGIGPNWFASIIDVNLPEHRGTMTAAASFMDAIGRAIGAWLGGAIIDAFSLSGSTMPISDTIIFCTLTFGILSSSLWLPILKYCTKDVNEVYSIMEDRARILEQQKELTIKSNDLKK